ncbi:hypothetical protein CFP56_037330 [Quercus suber]|uniref:Uncharacterized protein n=1 Tax=Quercus suber TaxID=58331 RepID=A0AAW0J4Y7_QUESU
MISTQKLPNNLEGKALHIRDSKVEAPKICYAKEMHVPKTIHYIINTRKVMLYNKHKESYGFLVASFLHLLLAAAQVL